MKSTDVFRQKYIYLNEITLHKATEESPELLVAILNDPVVDSSLVISLTIIALAVGGRVEYLPLIRSFLTHSAALVRESVYMGLFEYYENDPSLKLVLKEALLMEPAEGVKKTISAILSQMY